MIYSDAPTCRFCAAPVDRQAAEAGADLQKEVNNAVSLAKWIRNAAGAMWGLTGLGLVFGIASLAAIACIFLIPISLIYWQIKHGRLKTADADYAKTKRDRVIALLLWLGASFIQILIIVARIVSLR
ncbi:MAG: hypothetical protein ACRD9S_07125 [Pyrinomonadaceae bacterium]